MQGTWEIRDFSRYYQRVLKAQAHGRSVRHEGTTGAYALHFDGTRVRGEAEHLRLKFSTRLADRQVRYRVDIHGEFDSTVRPEGTNRLRVEPHTGNIKARESAHFEGGKVQSRRPKLPISGLYELDCNAKDLVLRPIEGGKTREPIRFARPGSPP